MLKRDVSHGKSKLQRTFTRILMYRYFPKTDCTQPMSNYRDRLTMFELQSFFFVAAPSMVGVLGFNLPKVEFDQASIGAPQPARCRDPDWPPPASVTVIQTRGHVCGRSVGTYSTLISFPFQPRGTNYVGPCCPSQTIGTKLQWTLAH